MKNYSFLFADQAAVDEFMDQLPDLVDRPAGGFEAFDSLGSTTDEAAATIRNMQEGTGVELDAGLEAIILRFKRPAYFVKKNTFDVADTPSTSDEVDAEVEGARVPIEAAIPSVGRVNLRNHRKPWVGTGWVVAPNVVVTNRHVASEFAEAAGDGFNLVQSAEGRTAVPLLDMYREYQEPTESSFRMREVLWIEPAQAGHHDVAFLSIDAESEDDNPQPPPISLMPDSDFEALEVGRWATVVGYPAQSPYNDRQDQQRIFSGVFNVKRLQPGRITALRSDGILEHDATTLGGNSGSTIVDLSTGDAIALHFGGIEGETNSAVAAPVVRRLLTEHVLNA